MVTATLTTLLDGLVVASSLALLPLLARQKLTSFRPVRGYLVLGYLLIVVWACLDFANLLTGTEASGLLYTLAGVPAILLSTLPLTLASIIVSRPKGHQPGNHLAGALRSHLGPNFPLFAFTFLVLVVVFSLGLVMPFTLQLLPLEFGGSIFRPSFQGWYVGAITLTATAFVFYPCRLMIVRSRTIGSKAEARAMLLLPLSWMIAAVLLVALRLYFPPGTLASRMASAIGIVVFGMTAYVFRRTDVLAGFVAQHAASLPASTPSHPFSRRLRLGSLEELGTAILLEHDPTQPYERAVKDYIDEANSGPAVVIVPSTSPLRTALKDRPNVMLFLLNGGTSYPTPGEKENEFMIPHEDTGLLLESLEKTIQSRDGRVSLIFGSLSDMIVASGTKTIYLFLKDSIDLILRTNSRGLFLLVPGAHSEETLAVIRSLFSAQLRLSADKMKVAKLGQASQDSRLSPSILSRPSSAPPPPLEA